MLRSTFHCAGKNGASATPGTAGHRAKFARWAVIAAALTILLPGLAARGEEFASASEERRYRLLLAELRCMVCPNQSLAESNSGLAGDLREVTWELMRDGKSDDAIREHLAARYSDFILYDPPFKITTALLWLGPVLLLAVALVVVRSVVSCASRHNVADENLAAGPVPRSVSRRQ